MRIRRVALRPGAAVAGKPLGTGFSVAVWDEPVERWVPVRIALALVGDADSEFFLLRGHVGEDVIAFLQGGSRYVQIARRLCRLVREREAEIRPLFDPTPILPFTPSSLRMFSLYERHLVQAARGMVRTFMPLTDKLLSAYEFITRGAVLPLLRPSSLYSRVPVHYVGHTLGVITDGAVVNWPPYCTHLDYELEVACVVVHPLRNASPQQALDAIGGFLLVNDFSARNVQLDEMFQSRLGLSKTKNFATALGSVVVTKDEVLPRLYTLGAQVLVNGRLWSAGSTQGPMHRLDEAVAFASLGESIVPGEVFSSGTLPGCSGVEVGRWLRAGDRIELHVDVLGSLHNVVGTPEQVSSRFAAKAPRSYWRDWVPLLALLLAVLLLVWIVRWILR